jgi:hypothetical protein
VGPGAAGFASALDAELGEHGWFGAGFDRRIWYANLVHFTGPIARPQELVDWVAGRRSRDLGVVEGHPQLLDWTFEQGQMVPVLLGRAA